MPGTPSAGKDGASGGIPWRSGALYLVVASAVMGPLDVDLVGPALPAIRDAFALSDAQSGLVITAFAVPGVLLAPVVGMLADRFGRRMVLVPCLLVYGIAGGMIVFATDFMTVLALRSVQGAVGGSILTSLALTLVGDLYEGTSRSAAMGLTTAAVSTSAALGPAIGGALAAISWNLPFGVYTVSIAVGIAVFFFLDEPSVEGKGGGFDPAYLRKAITAVPTGQAIALYGATLAAFTLFFGGLLTGATFLLNRTYGLGSGRIGAIITAALLLAAVVAILNGRLAHFLSNRSLIAFGFVGYGAGLAGAGVAGSVLGVGLALGLFGIGHGLAFPSLATALSDLGPGRFRGGIMSLRTSLVFVSQVIGPPLFTVPAVLTYDELMIMAGVLSIGSGMASVVLAGRRR